MSLKLTQKKEYREWIIDNYNSQLANKNDILKDISIIDKFNSQTNDSSKNAVQICESFTVYLGNIFQIIKIFRTST